MSKYTNEFMKNVTQLDIITNSCGVIIDLGNIIITDVSKEATISFLKKLKDIVDNKQYGPDVKRIAQYAEMGLIKFYGHRTLKEICNSNINVEEDTRTLQELLVELNALIGLEKVKCKVQDLIAYQKVQRLRQEKHLSSSKSTLHLAFMGNPGTGKTTVARIVGRIYKRIGLLSKGHFIEVSRTDLIAGYQGQTALKVKGVIEKARGGVLFIDEAYSITENDHSDSYGRECLTELTKALEDFRNDLVVIVAGYTEPMNRFFESNPGLKSRFNTFIVFDDYTPDELYKILLSMCKSNDYMLDDEVQTEVYSYFESQVKSEYKAFSNGRLVRNIYDDLVMNHARRVINLMDPSELELSLIKKDDFKFSIDENNNKDSKDNTPTAD